MNLLLPILLVLVALLVLVQVWQYRMLRRLEYRLREQGRRTRMLTDDMGSLARAALGAGDSLLRVEQQMRRLAERQDQAELHNPGERPYSQAIRLVRKGTTIEDLVSTCGLTRGEAELIAMLHGAAAQG